MVVVAVDRFGAVITVGFERFNVVVSSAVVDI